MKTRYRKMIIVFWVACLVVAFSLLFPTHVYADDCLSDPLNAADCMRTPGFRQVVAVTISVGGTLATIMVVLLGATNQLPPKAVTVLGNAGPTFKAFWDGVAMTNLKADLEAIDQDLKKKYYVLNKYQTTTEYFRPVTGYVPGLPGLLQYMNVPLDGLTKGGNMLWDTLGKYEGLTCEGYRQHTDAGVRAAVERNFPGAKVQQWDFFEKSSDQQRGTLDGLDAIAEDNHTFHKVTLWPETPAQENLSIDFHTHNKSYISALPIVRPFKDIETDWKVFIGEADFGQAATGAHGAPPSHPKPPGSAPLSSPDMHIGPRPLK